MTIRSDLKKVFGIGILLRVISLVLGIFPQHGNQTGQAVVPPLAILLAWYTMIALATLKMVMGTMKLLMATFLGIGFPTRQLYQQPQNVVARLVPYPTISMLFYKANTI